MIIILVAGLLLPLLIIGIWSIRIWNRVVFLKNNIEQAYSSIDVYLKERFELLPNLVSSLKKYTEYEKGVLADITALRAQIKNSGQGSDKVDAANKLAALSAELNLENYPELKADRQFIEFQQVLRDTEGKLAASRRAYNAAVIYFNNYIESFPGNILARIRDEQSGVVLETLDVEKKNFDVKQLFD